MPTKPTIKLKAEVKVKVNEIETKKGTYLEVNLDKNDKRTS